MAEFLVKFIAKLLVIFIPQKKLKRKIRDKIKTFFFGFRVITKAKKIGKNFVCRSWSYCTKNSVTIGDNVRIGNLYHHGFGKLSIGKNCEIGHDVRIITQNHNYDNGDKIPFGLSGTVYKDVIIEDCVWIGSNVFIIPGTIIREGAIIQGGAVVHGEIPRCAIAGGNPAKVFKYRDIEHFDKLKEEGAYLEYWN